jgi:hypothetical protein
MEFIWSEYIRHRAESREFDLGKIEEILRYSAERYFDTETNRLIAVGRHDERLIMVPYETYRDTIRPVTVHAVTRQQINFRIKTGRFTNEQIRNEIL